MDNRVVLIVGHNEHSQGAVNYLGETEWAFNMRVAVKIKAALDATKQLNCDIITYGKTKSSISDEVRRLKPFISIELHFNSFDQPAYGCECLVLSDSRNLEASIQAADILSDAISNAFKIKQRSKYINGHIVASGVKMITSGDRGYWNLATAHSAGAEVCILVEPVFGNFKTKESECFFENEDRYVQIIKWFVLYDVFGFKNQDFLI